MGEALIYVTNTDSDDISVVDARKRREVKRIAVGGSPRGSVRFDIKKMVGYVSNCAGNTISIIDLRTNKEAGRILVGLAPRGLVLSEDSRYAFISNSGADSLAIVDLRLGRQTGETVMGANPRHMARVPGRNEIVVAEWGADAVRKIEFDRETGEATRTTQISVGAGARPYSIAVSAAGDRAYVANTQATYMSVVNLGEGKEVARVEVGPGGRAIALSKDGAYGYLTVENSNQIAVIDLSNNEVVNRVMVGPSPRGIAIDYEADELFASPFSRSISPVGMRNALSVVSVREPVKLAYLADVPVGLGPCSVSILKQPAN